MAYNIVDCEIEIYSQEVCATFVEIRVNFYGDVTSSVR